MKIVTVSEKYETTGKIRGYLNDLAQPYRDDDVFMQPGDQMFIWVAYQLGYHGNFHALAEKWQMSGSINAGGDFVLLSGIKLSVDDEWMAEGLISK
jgi:hypothetical protein